MGERLRTSAAHHPGRATGVLAAVAVLCTALAAGWTDRLALSSDATRQAPLEIRASGPIAADSDAFRVAVRTMRLQISANQAVSVVRERRSQNPRATVLVVRFDAGGRRRDAAISRLQRSLDPGPLALEFRGEAAAARTAKDAALDDLWLLLPALAAIALLAIAMLGLRPAGAALLAAGAAGALACLLAELIGGLIDVSWLALVGAAGAAATIGLQLCAMARADAGADSIWLAALAAAAPFAAAALLGVDYVASLGLGGALAALLAAPAALLAAGASEGAGAGDSDPRGAGFWGEAGDRLGWSAPVAAVAGFVAIVLLAFAAHPVLKLSLSALGVAAPPAVEAAALGAAIAAACSVVAVIAGVAGRRAVLAGAGTIAFALPAAAVAGLLAAGIQEGWLDDLLDYVATGSISLGSLAAAVTVVAALGAAQLVALVAAARDAIAEEKGERVAEALELAGPAMTLSCLAGIAAGVALAFASPLFMKEFGLGVAAGLALQLVLAGLLLSPALLRLTPDRAPRQ